MQHHNEELQNIRSNLSDEQKRLNELNGEQGSSSLLTTIPLSEESYEGYNKSRFVSAIRVFPSDIGEYLSSFFNAVVQAKILQIANNCRIQLNRF